MQGMSLEQQLNSLTRLTILVFLVLLLLFNFSFAFIFLVLSLAFIIILYYIQRKIMQATVEKYTQNCPSIQPLRARPSPVLTPGPSYISKNQRLMGKVNPKTKIAPIIAPRTTDLEYWKPNNNVIHSQVNKPRVFQSYLSGSECTNVGLTTAVTLHLIALNFCPTLKAHLFAEWKVTLIPLVGAICIIME